MENDIFNLKFIYNIYFIHNSVYYIHIYAHTCICINTPTHTYKYIHTAKTQKMTNMHAEED